MPKRDPAVSYLRGFSFEIQVRRSQSIRPRGQPLVDSLDQALSLAGKRRHNA